MATFKSSKFIPSSIDDLHAVVRETSDHFAAKGFTTDYSPTTSGYLLSISKGGVFKAVLGLKTALNVDIKKASGGINVEAGVGIFGQQLIPTAIMMFVAWPVALSQIWGMIQQSKLDNEAIEVVEQAVSRNERGGVYTAKTSAGSFCIACGAKLSSAVKFCPECGAKQ